MKKHKLINIGFSFPFRGPANARKAMIEPLKQALTIRTMGTVTMGTSYKLDFIGRILILVENRIREET